MSPDDYQHAWKAHTSRTHVTVDADALLKDVQRSQESFRTTIFWRDVREAGTSLLLIPVWVLMGVTLSQPWTWYLIMPSFVWVFGFILVDRKRQRKRASDSGESLLQCAQQSLKEVEHQIWLLRHVGWWYLAPFGIPLLIYFCHVSWITSPTWPIAAVFAAGFCTFVLVLYGFIYYVNQVAVRNTLEPQRQELLALITNLSGETTDTVNGDYPILMKAERASVSRWRVIVGTVLFFVFLSIGVGGIAFFSGIEDGYPKKSPFEAVRWEGFDPEVQVDGEWFMLVSLDGIPASEIVDFSRRTFGSRWDKRFEEDLVELLTRMGHPAEDTVTLVVQSLTTSETQTLEAVRMTRANREAIRNAAQARERFEEMTSGISFGQDAAANTQSLAQALEEIRTNHDVPAMAAFAMRDGEIVARAAVGTRSTKDATPVGDDAQWHLGSNTKAMTATVAGMLVEEGLLEWDSTVGEVLGEEIPDMDPGNREITLAMLFRHTSGLPANISWYAAPEDRVACAAQILEAPPVGERGVYDYSNAGYVVAGAMMEAVTGKRWEDLMREKLFDPLGMSASSFGAPSRPGAPWGHRSGAFRRTPMDPSTRGSDNALVLGPAGTVHATLDDYARFVAAHMAGAQGEDGIVTAETFRMLHTPAEGGNYAMGWSISEGRWADGRFLSHSGSNTMWYATAWLVPEKDMAFFAATNVGGDTGSKAVDDAMKLLLRRHLDLSFSGQVD